jgi:hypothetical protein
MALNVKDAATSAAKFVSRAQAAGPAYTSGVANAGSSWQAATAAADSAYSAGVQTAITSGRFKNSITSNAASKFVTNASGKGSQRYPQGVAAAGPAWQSGVQPFLSALSSLTLPPRMPRGDPGNINRVSAVTAAMRAVKLKG